MARTVARTGSRIWHDVDDVEGFIAMKLFEYQPEKTHHALRVARNAKADWIRKELGHDGRKKNVRYVYSLKNALDEEKGFEEELELIDDYRGLSDEQKFIMVASVMGFSYEEIGEQMGVSKATVCRRVQKIREIIRPQLEIPVMSH